MQSAPQEPQRKRRRPALACVQCRRRKVRCDHEEPCGPCSRLGGGSGVSACWYQADQAAESEHAGFSNHDGLGAAGLSTTGVPIPPVTAADAFAVPGSDLASYWGAPNGTASAANTDFLGQPHGLGTLQPYGSAPPVCMSRLDLGDVQEHAPSVSDLQGRVQRVEELARQGNASSKQFDPLHSTLEQIATRLQRLEQNGSSVSRTSTSASSKNGSPAVASESSLTAPTTLPDLRSDPERTRFWGNSHYRHFIDQRFSLFGRLKSKDTAHVIRDSSQTNGLVRLVQRCRDLRRQIKDSHRSNAVDPFPNTFNAIPAKDVCIKLASAYFENIESIYRILHIPTFWSDLDRNWRNMGTAPVCFRIKLLLVIAIGSAFVPLSSPTDNVRPDIANWIHAAQWWLSGPTERMTFSIEGLQIRCLLLLACHVNSIGTKTSRWMLAASVRRAACSLGLHRDPSLFPNMTPLPAEVRKRLWATILELDVVTSLEANMPSDVCREAFDCGQPSDISDDEMRESDNALLPAHRRRQPSQTALQALLLGYLPLRLNVLRYLNAAVDDYSYEAALKLGTELRGMRRDVQSFLEQRRQSSSSPSNQATIFHARYLDSMILRYMLFLNRPFAIKAMHDPRFYFSRKECCEASFALLIPIAQNEPSLNDKEHLPTGSIASAAGGLSFDAVIYLCLELTMQFEEQGPQRPGSHSFFKDVAQDSRDRILALLRRVRDRLLKSIAEGDTSLKKFIFLASALSQIEATAAGKPAERALAETLENSLEQCQSLLLQHLPASVGPYEPDFSAMFGVNGQLPDFGAFAFEDIESWLQCPMNMSGMESVGGF